MIITIKLFLLLVLGHVIIGQDAGNPCTDDQGNVGICKFVEDCSLALNRIADGFTPKICSFQRTQLLVCCTETLQNLDGRIITPPPIPNDSTGDISKAKCKEYAKYAIEQTTDVIRVRKSSRRHLECPFQQQKLIVGGSKAERGEFPHMAQLGYALGLDLKWLCAGSIISSNFILTAGHCLNHKTFGSPICVRMGMTNLSDTTHVQTRKVDSIFQYPQYTFQKYHDIGLLKLDSDINLNTHARPACLYTENMISLENAIVTGWGRQSFKGKCSLDLRKVVLERYSAESCNKSWSREINEVGSELHQGILDDCMLCYGSKTDLKDACQGDSGGPLQIYYPETEDIKCMYQIVGITSFGKGCGMAVNTPGIYTRVSTYINWIENIVWPNQIPLNRKPSE